MRLVRLVELVEGCAENIDSSLLTQVNAEMVRSATSLGGAMAGPQASTTEFLHEYALARYAHLSPGELPWSVTNEAQARLLRRFVDSADRQEPLHEHVDGRLAMVEALGAVLRMDRIPDAGLARKLTAIYTDAASCLRHLYAPDGTLPSGGGAQRLDGGAQVRREEAVEHAPEGSTGPLVDTPQDSLVAMSVPLGFAAARSSWGPDAQYVCAFQDPAEGAGMGLAVFLGDVRLLAGGGWDTKRRTLRPGADLGTASQEERPPGAHSTSDRVGGLGSSDAAGFDLDVSTRRPASGGGHARRRVRAMRRDGSVQAIVTDVIVGPRAGGSELCWRLPLDAEVRLHSWGASVLVDGSKRMEMRWVVAGGGAVQVVLDECDEGGDEQIGCETSRRRSRCVILSTEEDSAHVETTIEFRPSAFALDSGRLPTNASWSAQRTPIPVNFVEDVTEGAIRLVVQFASPTTVGTFQEGWSDYLDDLKVSRLLVLDDFAPQGSGYYSLRMDRGPFENVQSALRQRIAALGFTPRDVIVVGAWSGATAALIHGRAMGAGRTIVTVPPPRYGTWLRSRAPHVLRAMTGGLGEAEAAWLDGALARELLASRDAGGLVDVVHRSTRGEMDQAADLVRRFMPANAVPRPAPGPPAWSLSRKFAGTVRDILVAEEGVDRVGVQGSSEPEALAMVRGHHVIARVVGSSSEEVRYAFYLYGREGLVEKRAYRKSAMARFDNLPAGSYRIRAFRREGAESESMVVSSPWVKVD